MRTHLLLALLLSPLITTGPWAAVIDFDSFSPPLSGLEISGIATAGVTFEGNVVVRADGQAVSSPNVITPTLIDEFNQRSLDIRFAVPQRSVRIKARPEASSGSTTYQLLVEGFDASGSSLGGGTTSISSTGWTTTGLTQPTAIISRLRILQPSSAGGTEFVRYDDLEIDDVVLDDTPPVVDVTLPASTVIPNVLAEVLVDEETQLVRVTIELVRDETGAVLSTRDLCGGPGFACPPNHFETDAAFELPDNAGTYTATVEACDASANCATDSATVDYDFTPPPTVQAYRFEINQGMQGRLRDIHPPGSGTSVGFQFSTRILPGKDTIVRYYLMADGSDRPNYRPRLQVTIGYRDGSSRNRTLLPNVNGFDRVSVPQRPATVDAREQLFVDMRTSPTMRQTANYIIAAEDLEDASTLSLRLDGEGAGTVLAGRTETQLTAPLLLGLNIIQAQFRGATPPVPIATLEQNWVTYLEKVMPFSDVEVLTRAPLGIRGASSCSDYWGAVNGAYGGGSAARRSSSDPVWSLTALGTPASICAGVARAGNRYDGILVSNPTGETAAHELGHVLGLPHAGSYWGECGGGTCESGWPYPKGHVGPTWPVVSDNVVPLGTSGPGGATATVIDVCPTADYTDRFYCSVADGVGVYDLLSYGSTTSPGPWPPLDPLRFGRFPSTRTFERLAYRMIYDVISPPLDFGPPPSFPGGGSGAAAETTEGLLLMVELPENKEPRLHRIWRRPVSAEALESEEGPYVLELRNSRDELLLERKVQLLDLYDLEQPTPSLSEWVPVLPDLQSLAIYDPANNTLLMEEESSEHAPVVELLKPKGGEIISKGDLEVEWQASDADNDELSTMIQISYDEGASWNGLAVIVPPLDANEGSTYSVDVAELPKGQALLRVVVVDRFHQAVDGTECTVALGTQEAPSCGFEVGADTDGDAVPNIDDICPTVYDPEQKDSNNDGQGDACCGELQGVVPIPGDANRDGVVDGGDYTLWADHFGTNEPAFDRGDFNCDDETDGADYTVWADHFGEGDANLPQ